MSHDEYQRLRCVFVSGKALVHQTVNLKEHLPPVGRHTFHTMKVSLPYLADNLVGLKAAYIEPSCRSPDGLLTKFVHAHADLVIGEHVTEIPHEVVTHLVQKIKSSTSPAHLRFVFAKITNYIVVRSCNYRKISIKSAFTLDAVKFYI